MSSSLSGTDVDAFVLAGGRSSRMGRDKALIQLAGVPLVERALGIFRRAGLSPRIAGGGSELSSFAPVIQDNAKWAGLGPLTGICSALAATRARYSIFLTVDLPLIPDTLVSYLIHHATISESAVTVASLAGFIQTFPAVIDRAVHCGLEESLQSDDRKCLAAFEEAARHVSGEFSVLPVELLAQAGQVLARDGLPPSRWFLNVNAPNDLALAHSLLSGGASGCRRRGVS